MKTNFFSQGRFRWWEVWGIIFNLRLSLSHSLSNLLHKSSRIIDPTKINEGGLIKNCEYKNLSFSSSYIPTRFGF